MFAAGQARAVSLAVAARAIIALAAGLVVTFSADHSAAFGLLVFGTFAAATALVFVWAGRIATHRASRLASWTMALAAAASTVLAFTGGGLALLTAVLIGFAAVTGAIELAAGIMLRADVPNARDSAVVGSFSLGFAAIVALIPFDFSNAWESVTKDGSVVNGVVTADVFVVGVFGAYTFVVGVFLAIAAVSMRSTAATTPERVTARVSGE